MFLMRPTSALLFLALCITLVAARPLHAQRNSTSAALDRMQEAMRPALDDGALQGVAPLILVGAAPAFEETRAWFPAAVLDALVEVFGPQSLRACEACMAPRLRVQSGAMCVG